VSRIKTLKRLSAVRTRMRDAAAAAASQAAQREHAAKNTRDAREHALVDHDASLMAQLAVAQQPQNALELFHADREIATDMLVTATTDWKTRGGESAKARGVLGARERELQVAEKLLEEARTERDTRIAKYEQSTADDLTSARKRRDK
jgi:hypothetical protein